MPQGYQGLGGAPVQFGGPPAGFNGQLGGAFLPQ